MWLAGLRTFLKIDDSIYKDNDHFKIKSTKQWMFPFSFNFNVY